jgi:hypothetical protein
MATVELELERVMAMCSELNEGDGGAGVAVVTLKTPSNLGNYACNLLYNLCLSTCFSSITCLRL